jgi:hypothetical protein
VSVTHAELVIMATRWLAGNRRASVVISEMSGGSEMPDAIGWPTTAPVDEWGTTLIECKVSMSDLRADRKKRSRNARPPGESPWPAENDFGFGFGLGEFRYYLVSAELAERAKAYLREIDSSWGLLVARKNPRWHPRVVRVSSRHKSSLFAERGMLISALRRVGGAKSLEVVYVRAYVIQPGNDRETRVTLGIRPEDRTRERPKGPTE